MPAPRATTVTTVSAWVVSPAIKRINVHGYQGRQGRRDALYSLATQSNKALWNSECGDDDGTGRHGIPEKGVLVIVTANRGPDRSVDFDLCRFRKTWKDGDPVSQWTTKVDGSNKYQKEKNIPIQGTMFRSWVEKGSVQTCEIHGVTMW